MKLENLCKYYLDCIALEYDNAVSASLIEDYGVKYTELSNISIDEQDDVLANLFHRVSSQEGLVSHIGYPVIVKNTLNRGKYTRKIIPVLLFSVEISGGMASISPVPHVNIEAIKIYSSNDSHEQMSNLLDLEMALGLESKETSFDLIETVSKLEQYKWNWKEKLDPNSIDCEYRIIDASKDGGYNRAIFIVDSKSSFTAGLEIELNELSKLREDDYRNTALYDWIHETLNSDDNDECEPSALLEVLPMNTEQELAIQHAFARKLTIVTGPPGTGKSQVVTNLIINATLKKQRVLFASKNNKAVDVVEERVNSLAQRPVMSRMGGKEYAKHLADLVDDSLNVYANEEDRSEYEYYESVYNEKVRECEKEKVKKDKIIALRNSVDRLEQRVCSLRGNWRKWFDTISDEELDVVEVVFSKYESEYRAHKKAQNSFVGRVMWSIFGKKRTAVLCQYFAYAEQLLQIYDLSIGIANKDALDDKCFEAMCAKEKELLYALHTLLDYKKEFNKLIDAESLEAIDFEVIKLKQEMSVIAKKLWNQWLKIRPLKVSASDRRALAESVAGMRYADALKSRGSYNAGFFKQYSFLQKKVAQLLPCIAITSLSVKGRIPFEAGMYDLAVIDEASQCDIASILPILYRAKRAVIMGDSKQLKHISAVPARQDVDLMQNYGIPVKYGYAENSLYDLASGLSGQTIRLRDHHRCFGEIIEFSNKEFYGEQLRIATDYDKLNYPEGISPGIHWIDVKGKVSKPDGGSAYNIREAIQIVETARKIIVEKRFGGTVGIITPFRAQAEKIKELIRKDTILAERIGESNVDTVHKFQGDERDVVFFSTVLSHGMHQGALSFMQKSGNLFNVAITRARAVLIVVGDLNSCKACDVIYLRNFAEYASRKKSTNSDESIDHDLGRVYPKVSNPEDVSRWERLLYTALYDAGIKAVPQYAVDKYKLDLAIIRGKRKLDIEVDGERYHRDWSGELSYRDQLRNRRLFEIGWEVKRFWVYQVRDDMQGCINQIKQWCQENE